MAARSCDCKSLPVAQGSSRFANARDPTPPSSKRAFGGLATESNALYNCFHDAQPGPQISVLGANHVLQHTVWS